MKKSAQEKRNLSSLFKAVLIPVLLAGLLLLSGCGEQEQTGAEDYAYLFREIPDYDLSPGCGLYSGNFKASGGYLYYLDKSIYRIPLKEEPDFTARETVAEQASLERNNEDEIICFTVDEDRNLYYCGHSYYRQGFSLYKYSEDGELVFYLPITAALPFSSKGSAIALDREKNIYLLSNTSLLRISPEGTLTGTLSLADELGSESSTIYLLNTSLGRIYLFSEYMGNRKSYEVSGEETPRLTLVNELSAELDFSSLFESPKGILTSSMDGHLYQYDPDTDTTETLLYWAEWDINQNNIGVIVPLSEDLSFLTMKKEDSTTETRGILLSRVPADQVPRKERIVLASLSPSDELKASVVDFNRSSTQYHVSIESYGLISMGFGYQGDADAATVRLDSALTGSDTPDLLDLSFGNFFNKYARTDALEDLAPYIENSSIRKEDFLSNLLEGYTIDGKLTCIPQSFNVLLSYSSDPRMAEVRDWSMESLMALDEKYPDVSLFPGELSSWLLLHRIYSPYYLEKYVDWEKGECSFDSDGFRRLLNWMKTQLSDTSKGGLLHIHYLNCFENWAIFLAQYGENTQLYGLPSADGKEAYYILANDLVGMLKNSRHKEGAWAFLEYYYQRGYQSEWNNFPTRLDRLKEREEQAGAPIYLKDENGEKVKDSNGNYVTSFQTYTCSDGTSFVIHPLEQEDTRVIWDLFYSLDFTPPSMAEEAIIGIVEDEFNSFLNGSKTAEEVSRVIQSRAALVIQENQ